MTTHLLGIALVLLPLISLFVYVWQEPRGVIRALLTACAFASVVVVAVGVYLL